jgi:cell division protein FtsW
MDVNGRNIKGDRVIWAIMILLGLVSLAPVFSASSNIGLSAEIATNWTFFIKHLAHLAIGFSILYAFHLVPFKRFGQYRYIFIVIAIVLLIITFAQGTTIKNVTASRWIRIPIVGLTFQTSTLASVLVMIFTAKYMAGYKNTDTFQDSFLQFWIWVGVPLMLILPGNFSTTALLFLMILLVLIIGGYKFKHLSFIIGIGVAFLGLFILLSFAFPNVKTFNRASTWISRVKSHADGEDNLDKNYQIDKAKIAIASGGLLKFMPGSSKQKNFLPQSESDFIYAIIIEEYGLITGVVILMLYLLFFFRVLIVANKTDNKFASLLVIALALPIVSQALVNIVVNVDLGPVTGQTLPLISNGGSSIWMICFAVGIILSVSREVNELEAQRKEEERETLEEYI